VKPSKGRRGKKRKRKEAAKQPADSKPVVPPPPEIGSFVDVGLSVITRSLGSVGVEATSNSTTIEEQNLCAGSQGSGSRRPYSAIFVARSGQPSILNSHLPQMVALASRTKPGEEPIRLVGLSKACQDRMSEALGIPRVSIIGLRENAPNSKALVDYTRHYVPAIEVAWLKEARAAEFMDTKIDTIETTIGQRERGKRRIGVTGKA
jgi:ribonuclease P/MRP protein subunit POP3